MGKLLKAYLYGILISVVVVVFNYIISSLSPKITSDELAISILLNIIQLDGLLFGFSAVVFGLIFTKQGTKIPKEFLFRFSVVSFASFTCYVFSLFIDISLLSKPEERYLALFPAGVAISGAMISSLYMVAILLAKPLLD